MVNLALARAKNGATNGIKDASLRLLCNLSVAPKNQVHLFETLGVVDVTLASTMCGAADEIKEAALNALRHLSAAAENQVRLFIATRWTWPW